MQRPATAPRRQSIDLGIALHASVDADAKVDIL